MKLSTKLKISFGVLILVPIALLIIALALMTLLNAKEVDDGSVGYPFLTNQAALVNRICEKERTELVSLAKSSPDTLFSEDYLKGVNEQLQKKCSFLLVVSDGKVIFQGSPKGEELIELLQQRDNRTNDNDALYFGDELQMIVKRVSFSNGAKSGYAYIVMQLNELAPQVKNWFIDVIICIILILVMTSASFTVWIYKETVSPINKLKLATNNIKDGNLDFDMRTSGKSEIAELCRDFDEMRIKLKENAEEKLKNDAESKILISNISHDLKTPITAIKGYVEGIMDGVADNEEKMDRYIKTIYNKACDMDKLIDELTLYSKIDTNKLPYNFTKTDVKGYFDDCADDVKLEVETSGSTFEYQNEIDEYGKVFVMADAEQLKRVVLNIISNSLKYGGREKMCIKLRVYEENEKINIVLSDDGAGIEEKDLPHIFDRFYRADASRNTGHGGSGIGLSIVKKIVEDHQGTITAESKKDFGTKMQIRLPKRNGVQNEQNTDN